VDVDTREGPRIGDAFGAMLLACLEADAEAGSVPQIVERDDGYLDCSDSAGYFFPYERWDELDRRLADRVTGRVLDLGAGAGRAALHFQDKGHEVTALDISPLACEVCRRRGVRNVVEGTVFELKRSGKRQLFDNVLLLGNNLGLLESRRQVPSLLEAFAALTRPGASILGRGLDPYATDNPYHLAYHERNRALGRMGGQTRIRVRHRDLATPYFDFLFASIDELRSLLAGTGWELEEYELDRPAYAAVIKKG
jgi:SAM-dependent methyltransferase